MATTGRNHLTTSHDRSPFILERRRKLFPIDDYDIDSDLGDISPLCSDTNSDSEDEGVSAFSDYDAFKTKPAVGSVTPTSSASFSPLKLSPYSVSSMKNTPIKYSPSHSFTTPHDTSTKPVLQREQKSLLEESKSLKRKCSPSSSPEQNKQPKSDSKSSKVRTALFPENDIYALPTKSFYSNNQENIREKVVNKEKYVPKPLKFSITKHSFKPRKKFGQINNGVRHKIRKPKQKKMSKALITEATKKMLETGAALNNYIQDLAELKKKQASGNKLIVNPVILKDKNCTETGRESESTNCLNSKDNLQTPNKLISVSVMPNLPQENKENIEIDSQKISCSPPSNSSPEYLKPKKFFRSSRANNFSKEKKCIGKKKNIVNKVFKAPSTDLPVNESQKIVVQTVLKNNNDFEDDEMEPETNIADILSVLSDESPTKPIIEQNKGQQMDYFENSCIDASLKSNSNFSNPLDKIFNQGGHIGQAESSNNMGSCCEVLETAECESVDNNQYLQSMNFTDCINYLTTNDPHLLGSNMGSFETAIKEVPVIESHNIFNVDPANIGNVCNSNELELQPSIISSQVVFNNILLEDGEQSGFSNFSSEGRSILNDPNTPGSQKKAKNTNKITLEAYNSVLASENSIHLHQNKIANTILSPISQMCNVTSGLALNSPKRGRNLSSLLNNMSRASKILSFTTSRSIDMEQPKQQQKLFPVFYPGAKGVPERGEKRERGEVKRNVKKFKALHEDQMLLDAGQKKFGYTICNECNIVYHMGDPGDELEHLNYHNANHILRFKGWKNEHLVGDFQKNGRIIRVLPHDSKIWLKKVKDLMDFVKRDLGCYEIEYNITGAQVYLYIKNRTIAGCAVATVPREGGHRMLSTISGVAMCSEESYPIKCGISHIWVAQNFRKQRIATALLDAVKRNFVYGYILADNDIAFTSPTEAGSAFAEKYFKTPNYLVYYT